MEETRCSGQDQSAGYMGPVLGGTEGGKPVVLRPPGPWSSALQMTTYLRTSSCLTNWPCASTGGCSSSRMSWGTRSAAGLSTGRATKSPRCAAPPLSMPRRRSRPRSEGAQGLVREGHGGWQDQGPGQRQLSRSGRGKSITERSRSSKFWGLNCKS